MAVRKDKQKGWMVDILLTFSNGRKRRIRKKSPIQTHAGALAFEAKLRSRAGESTTAKEVQAPVEVPTLKQFSQEFMSTYVRANNGPNEQHRKKVVFKLHILPVLGRLHLDEITTRHVERLKATLLNKSLSHKSVNNILAVLGKCLRYAREDLEMIEKLPRMRPLKVCSPSFDFLEFDEAERLLDAARRTEPDWYAMIFVAMRTGLRLGELRELRWSDVDLHRGQLRIQRAFTKGHVLPPKSGKPRVVDLSPATVKVLKSHRHLRGELVFCAKDGKRICDSTADDAIKRCCKRAGLRYIGWHRLRHTYASHLTMKGVPLRVVQELLGHSTITMTMRYSHLAPQVKQESVALLDEMPTMAPTMAPAADQKVQSIGKT